QTEMDRWFGRRDGELIFRRGKHKGDPLAKVAATAPDYLRWMLGAEDMDEEVLRAVREALEGIL
ncbi:MAG: 3'-5' exonuclease, partial [Gemmatimonadota bacterium]